MKRFIDSPWFEICCAAALAASVWQGRIPAGFALIGGILAGFGIGRHAQDYLWVFRNRYEAAWRQLVITKLASMKQVPGQPDQYSMSEKDMAYIVATGWWGSTEDGPAAAAKKKK